MAGLMVLALASSRAQTGFDNPTRALYIFDLAKYVDFGPGFADSSSFKVGMLVGDYDLINEMAKLARTRTRIQDKPVSVVGFRNLDNMTHVQVLYVNKEAGFNLAKVKAKIAGQHTMLITEGYEFREAMMNFIVVNGKPRFDVNEDYLKQEGLSVPQTLLFTAVKTKEDWQNLFDIASKEIEVQKETIRQQLETIDVQRKEILAQRALLDSLDKQIVLKEKTLNGTSSRLMRSLIPNSELKLFDCGHLFLMTRQEESVRAINEFLDEA